MISNYDVTKGHEFLFKSMSYVYDKSDNINLILIGTGTDDEIFNVNEQIRMYLQEDKFIKQVNSIMHFNT